MSWPSVAVRVIAGVTVVAVLADVAAVVVGGDLRDRVYVGVAVTVAILTVVLSLVVSKGRPHNLVAPLLGWMALLPVLVSFSDTYTGAQQRRPDLLPELPAVAAALLLVLWVWLYVAVAMLMLLFPDGRPPGRGWRWVAWALPAVGVAIQVLMMTAPGRYDAPYGDVRHPFGELPSSLALGLKIVLFPTLVALVVASAAAMWARFRRGDETTRAQVKWLALAALGLPLTAILSWAGYLAIGTNGLALVGFAFLYAAVPVAVTIAILQHRLYDVDRALSAAVTYGVATVALLAVFTIASVVSGVLLGRDSAPVAALSTAVLALALAPLRRWLQRGVDRRVYPMRRDAMTAIGEVHASISSDLGGPEQLQDRLRVALRDPTLRVAYLAPDGGFVDALGRLVVLGADAAPIVVSGQQVGALDTAGPASPELRAEVAAAAAFLVEMGRLRLATSAALVEAESSRSRLQRLGYEERRRLERDLHDGAQQRLVSLGMSLRLAQRHLDSVDLDGLLDESVAQLGTAVAELREVAHGLRPSCLDDGLYPALSVLARTVPLPIDLDIAADRAVPDDVATTAYYVVSEAVANAVKHAEASRIALRVEHEEGQLRVTVEDDGRGSALIRPGSGLAGLADRVAAAGGRLRLHSPPGRGTTVEAMLPCAS